MSASNHSDLVRLSFSLDEQSIKNLCTTTEGEKFKKIQQTLYSVGITLDIDPSSKELSITLDNGLLYLFFLLIH